MSVTNSVTCRIGSLEKFTVHHIKATCVTCRIGSLEIPENATHAHRLRYLPHRQLRKLVKAV